MPPDRAPRAKKRGARLLRLAVIFITTVALVDALVGDKGLIATMRARREYTELTARLARMRLENAGLRESARRLREDPDAIEELARRELGLIRVGETLFIIRDVAPAGSSPTPAPLDDER
jgi:cell division protein FtsB